MLKREAMTTLELTKACADAIMSHCKQYGQPSREFLEKIMLEYIHESEIQTNKEYYPMNIKTPPPTGSEPKSSQVMTEVEAYANIITATERLCEKLYDRFNNVLREDDGKDQIGFAQKTGLCNLAQYLSDLNIRLMSVNLSLEKLTNRAEN